ncbi:DUF6446 family protein [Loktanella agnita]|uniref:DUF6446 family protein n=1 Tax=Loktanella agnita TaxID=287097 RepID=UPI00398719DA
MARFILAGMLVIALIAGAALYYLQVYAFYDEVNAEVADVRLTSVSSGQAESVSVAAYQAVDADSSPIRYRACFTMPLSQAMLTETYVVYDAPEPRVAPGWFDCFDAAQIGEDLQTQAIAFLGVENIHYGIDRIVAVYPDGRAFAWHQINECGAVVFDGDPVPAHCPPVPESQN